MLNRLRIKKYYLSFFSFYLYFTFLCLSYRKAFNALNIGTFFALLLTLSNIKHKTLITFMGLIPMLIPAQITAVSWFELVSPSARLVRYINIQLFSNPLS